jgi:hypothetical protein
MSLDPSPRLAFLFVFAMVVLAAIWLRECS